MPQHPLPGDRLALRLTEHVADATTRGPSLATAWSAIPGHPQRALLPYAPLAGEAAYRAVQVAFADSDVADYGAAATASAHGARGARPLRASQLDPVWNRTRAVYRSRDALFVPSGASITFRVALPPHARLETAYGAITDPTDGKRPLGFHVLVDGKERTGGAVDRARAEQWWPLAIDLDDASGREVTVTFAVDGGAGSGFFANPIVWSRGGGAPGPNVLVVVIDTLRRDALPVMPNLQKLASRGARFDQAVTAATWTRPSLLALYGGDLPSAVGQSAEDMIPSELARHRFYRLAPPLLPRILDGAGWRVSAIGNNFFLLGYPQIGLDLGFSEVDDVRHPVLDTPAITRAAARFFDENKDRAWLLHLHYDAPHWPYTPPPEYLARVRGVGGPEVARDPLWSKYLAEAAYADDYLGRVLDALDRDGLAERTLVIVLGDHGEVFDPSHGHTVEALGLPTLHHHGWSAYEEITRIPLVVALPKTIAPTVVTAQVRSFDLTRTILDYLGVDGKQLPARGRSLRALIEGHAEPDERVALTEGQDVRALRSHGVAYLERSDGRLTVGKQRVVVPEELYRLADDPTEHRNLVAQDPALLARMRALLAAEAPVPPRAPTAMYHLRVAPDARPHRVTGTISVAGELGVRAVTGGEVEPLDGRSLRLSLDARGGCDLSVDPPEAAIDLALAVDGVPLPASRVLVGEFALPLVDGPLAGARLRRLEARHPPEPGERGGVLLWRDESAAASAWAAAPEAANPSELDEVGGMMRRWGYAQSKSK